MTVIRPHVVGRRDFGAVVAGEDDQSVVGKIQTIQSFH